MARPGFATVPSPVVAQFPQFGKDRFRIRLVTQLGKCLAQFRELKDAPDASTVFAKLRELRNNW